ncbi:VOC family protein [Streptomyces sp. NPDC051976]|uniref:VOC family protein n=1 Tax=Streptomyces sp. NPDC051976 TaxID=3154947 RepID=UPI00343EBF51
MATNGFTTCLWFDGQAEEAADYYVSVFKDTGSERGRLSRVTEAGPGEPGSVLAVEFTANGQRFLALNGGPQFTFNESVSFQIHCADQAEVDHYWRTLTEGGGEESVCGWLKDRYGVSWQVIPEAIMDLMVNGSDREAAARATTAMLSMRKLDIAALQKAYDGG